MTFQKRAHIEFASIVTNGLDATPGQKLGDLPIVHSNWLTIFESPPTASKN